jgi:hypothetical protein
VLDRGVRVKTLRLDGIRVERDLLKNVLQTTRDIGNLGVGVHTQLHARRVVEVLQEVEMPRLKELRVRASLS